MEDSWQTRLCASVGDSKLWKLRKRVILSTAHDFVAVGKALSEPFETDEDTRQGIYAFALLMQMAGELAFVAGKMLSEKEHYAGAALVRQLVEIEYLTWTFKEGHRSASKWLNSTHNERMKMFTPSQLRKTSKGRFLSQDYQYHCQQGGHPVPLGSFLLDGQSPGSAQILLVDLIVHCWRTWDQLRQWSINVPAAASIALSVGRHISPRLNQWGARDPMYELMVERYPEKKA